MGKPRCCSTKPCDPGKMGNLASGSPQSLPPLPGIAWRGFCCVSPGEHYLEGKHCLLCNGILTYYSPWQNFCLSVAWAGPVKDCETHEGESYGTNKVYGRRGDFEHGSEMPCLSWNGKGLGREQGLVPSLRRLWRSTERQCLRTSRIFSSSSDTGTGQIWKIAQICFTHFLIKRAAAGVAYCRLTTLSRARE